MYYGMGVARPPFASDIFDASGRRRWITPGDFTWMPTSERDSYGFNETQAYLLWQRNPGLFIPTEIYNASNPDGITDLVNRAALLDPYELWNASSQGQSPVPADITIVGENWYGNIITHYAELEVPGHPEAYAEPYVVTPSGEVVVTSEIGPSIPMVEPNNPPNQPSAVTELPSAVTELPTAALANPEVTLLEQLYVLNLIPDDLLPAAGTELTSTQVSSLVAELRSRDLVPDDAQLADLMMVWGENAQPSGLQDTEEPATPQASTTSALAPALAIGGIALLASGLTVLGIGALAFSALSSTSAT
jgi:hypothetical protein